jgi:hypothetical protein
LRASLWREDGRDGELIEMIREWMEKEGVMCIAQQIEVTVRVVDSETSQCPHCAACVVVPREH